MLPLRGLCLLLIVPFYPQSLFSLLIHQRPQSIFSSLTPFLPPAHPHPLLLLSLRQLSVRSGRDAEEGQKKAEKLNFSTHQNSSEPHFWSLYRFLLLILLQAGWLRPHSCGGKLHRQHLSNTSPALVHNLMVTVGRKVQASPHPLFPLTEHYLNKRTPKLLKRRQIMTREQEPGIKNSCCRILKLFTSSCQGTRQMQTNETH